MSRATRWLEAIATLFIVVVLFAFGTAAQHTDWRPPNSPHCGSPPAAARMPDLPPWEG